MVLTGWLPGSPAVLVRRHGTYSWGKGASAANPKYVELTVLQQTGSKQSVKPSVSTTSSKLRSRCASQGSRLKGCDRGGNESAPGNLIAMRLSLGVAVFVAGNLLVLPGDPFHKRREFEIVRFRDGFWLCGVSYHISTHTSRWLL